MAAPLRSHAAAIGRKGLGEQTSGSDDWHAWEQGQVRLSWQGDPGAADHLFEEHELGVVFARRVFGA
jgi:hypothetical protein